MDELSPVLTEEGKTAAQAAINRVREAMTKAAINIIEQECADMYTDIAEYVESDSWSNYRNSVIQGVAGYRDLYRRESKPIRDRILRDNREDLIKDLNQDLIDEVEALKKEIRFLRECRY